MVNAFEQLRRQIQQLIRPSEALSAVTRSTFGDSQLPLAQIREIQKRLLDAKDDSPEPIWETLRQGEQEGQIQDIEIYKRVHGQDIKTQNRNRSP
jgi:hypothetical protein